MTIRELKRGDYFKLKENGKVYVRGDYDRGSKKYSYSDFFDMMNEHFAKGSKPVIVDFEF
jgi:hypothetical protein